ncbi:hypothetical protein JTE90_006607 [Oedothorax gibbosus]|uniref:Uncharacterized protein n=1 Tax=Oedothorax gibbosus TaxID=931172 RepID=A0AAV6U7P5_9ARAC|nr:hypothetical protein JTE90_006607 [Oedothorax gibbosus]
MDQRKQRAAIIENLETESATVLFCKLPTPATSTLPRILTPAPGLSGKAFGERMCGLPGLSSKHSRTWTPLYTLFLAL